MKFSLDIAYLLGLMHCKSKKGIGVKGRAKEIFVKLCEQNEWTNKFLYTTDSIYFYNSRFKNALERFFKERKYRFIAINDYSANYFAGWFDCCGEYDKVFVKLCNADDVDKSILNKLNFRFSEKGKDVYILKATAFLRFIRDYTRLKDVKELNDN
jgi:hypothetical protein